MLLHLKDVAADRGQLRHRLGTDKIGAPEMLRCARDLGLKARAWRTKWSRLARTPLPAIASLRDGGFMLLAKATEDKVLVQSPQTGPVLMTREEFVAVWDGGLILDGPPGRPGGRRAAASTSAGSWARSTSTAACWARCWSPRSSCSSSRLISPLFFQVVIDKVLVHRGLSTLDVLVIGLRGDRRSSRPCCGILRTYLFSPHHQPHRRRARRPAVPPPAGAADRLLPGAAGRRFGGARARAGEHPQLPHRLGADAGDRPVLHLRLPRGDVLLRAAADLDRARLAAVLCRDLGRR